MQKELKIILGVLFVIFSLGFVPSGARAQTVPDSSATPSYPVVSKRNPWAAFGLSFLLPGLGQFYNHETKKGVIMMGIYIPTAFYSNWATDINVKPNKEITDSQRILSDIALLGASCIWIWSWIDAPVSAKRINRLNGYGLSKTPTLQLGVYPSPRDPKQCQVGLALTKGF